MNKRARYILTILITAFVTASLSALPAAAAQLKPVQKQLKSDVKIDKADFTAVRQKLQLKAQAEAAKSKAAFETKRANFERDQKAQLDSRNAQAMRELQGLKANAAQVAKIRAEAIQMNSKYASASPSEKARMDKRADELIAQLKNLGY